MSTSPIDRLLPLLAGVKRTGPARWVALSPTRDERTPSLAIRELDDGRVLLHDFGGADVHEVLRAVGLDVAALFPTRSNLVTGTPRTRRPWIASEVLRLAAFESTVCVLITADLTAGRDADRPRLLEAARRLSEIAEVVNAR